MDNVVEIKRRGPYSLLNQAIAEKDGEACLEHMSDLQRNFCHEYLKDLNASRAVLRAGYKTNNPNRIGSELKTKEHINIALEYLQKDRADKVKLDANFVIQKILKSIERAEGKENEQAVLRGAELLAKHLGMFIEKQEISGPDGGAIEMKRRIEQDVADFTRSISRLAKSSGTDEADGGDDTGADTDS